MTSLEVGKTYQVRVGERAWVLAEFIGQEVAGGGPYHFRNIASEKLIVLPSLRHSVAPADAGGAN